MKIQFLIDPDIFTWEELEALEAMKDGQLSFAIMRQAVAKSMTDGSKYLPIEEARGMLRTLTRPQILEVLMAFAESWSKTKDESIPPPSGGDS